MPNTRRQFLKQISLSALGLAVVGCSKKTTFPKPNIIFIMIDDLGYGDIGCYGSKINKTPNIDRLAAGGIKFTDYHTNGPMCSPTRASLMTGMYQHRFGKKFERAIDGKRDYDDGLPHEAYTIPEALKKAGYATGMYGKWHLGYKPPFLPADQGFDEFIGLGSGDGDHHSHIDRNGRKDWWDKNELKMEEGYSTDLITDHSVDFIERHKDEPFFLYVSHLSIHFPWQGPGDPTHRKEGIKYHQDKWGIIPDKKNVSPHVKAMVESIDKGVGKIVKTLENLGLTENTLLVFTSDNGGYINYGESHFNISSNGPLRGQKAEVWEGGHRVPFIAYWPGKIKPGVVSKDLMMTMDMFPTFAELTGAPVPENINFDGINVLSHFLKGEPIPERAVCWKMDDERAIRKGKWKMVSLGRNKGDELYDLENDIGESKNVASQNFDLALELVKEYFVWERDVTANYEAKSK